jgi:A/G-specific adenine glycosylase
MTGATFSERLLGWFDQHGRKHLPWQQDVTPYRVWISEIMLQQTQVATVIPYFERFIARFPTVESLAGASDDEVMHLWTGLGYYARARNLHKTAKIIADTRQRTFPATLDELMALPGIGRSTAGAILAIACNRRAPILDGNVKRVLARYFGVEGWPGETRVANELWALAEELTPTERVADYTQAIMDLGATVCIRAEPACLACPFSDGCIARTTGQISQLPGKKPRKEMPIKSTCMLMVENHRGELLLAKRPPQGLWGGLWSLPECDPDTIAATLSTYEVNEQTTLPKFRHTFTHFHLDITPVHVKLRDDHELVSEPNQQCWYSPAAPAEIGLTRPATRLIKQLKELQGV